MATHNDAPFDPARVEPPKLAPNAVVEVALGLARGGGRILREPTARWKVI